MNLSVLGLSTIIELAKERDYHELMSLPEVKACFEKFKTTHGFSDTKAEAYFQYAFDSGKETYRRRRKQEIAAERGLNMKTRVHEGLEEYINLSLKFLTSDEVTLIVRNSNILNLFEQTIGQSEIVKQETEAQTIVKKFITNPELPIITDGETPSRRNTVALRKIALKISQELNEDQNRLVKKLIYLVKMSNDYKVFPEMILREICQKREESETQMNGKIRML